LDATAANSPKRRDSARTKAAILRSAQIAFATRGYADVGLRDIGRDAGVDPALAVRYFGSKEALFRDALKASIDLSGLLAGGRERFGVTAVSRFLDAPRGEANPLPMMVLATADPVARAVALEHLESDVLQPLAAWLGGDDAMSRAVRITMLCTGFFTYFELLPANALSGGVDPATRRWLEVSLQALADGGPDQSA